jgi:GNAT superfamily N-acetyltransferase
MLIRRLTQEDLAAAGEIAATMRPAHLDAKGLTLLQDVYRVSADRFCLAAQSSDRGEVRGCGALWRVREAKHRLDVMVHPEWQRQGIGGALLARLLAEAEQQGASTAQARARDDRPETLSFLQKRGFVEIHRMQRFYLDLGHLGPRVVEQAVQRATAGGITFAILAEEQERQPECLRKLHALQLAVIPDWPDPDPGPREPRTFDDLLRLLQVQAVAPEQLLLAKREDHLVGYCGSLGTAVHPAHRGQGIATALEAKRIQQALVRGDERLIGASANPAMRAVYAKVGYQREFAEVRMVRRLGEEE